MHLGLYEYPDTTVKSTPLYNFTLALSNNSIHSLFLTGTVSAPDTLYTSDVLPYYPPGDSVVGIRFVNLSPGSNPISVNITGNPLGSEANSLAYKGLSNFHQYPATSSISSYTFEFHDVATGNMLASYTLNGINNIGSVFSTNNYVYRNYTLALIGANDSTGTFAQNCLLINNY